MKKYLAILAMILIGHDLFAWDKPQDFRTSDTLIAYIKQAAPEKLFYDTNGIIVGMALPLVCCTDHNLRLLSEIKTLRYLHLFGLGGDITTNGIFALAGCSNLTGLGLTCGGSSLPSKHFVPALPCLTNLQSLELTQTSYMTNDATYLAKMTNLIALKIAGRIPQTQLELLSLASMVNLRKLLIFGDIEHLNTNVFSKLNKSTKIVVSSSHASQDEAVWKTSFRR